MDKESKVVCREIIEYSHPNTSRRLYVPAEAEDTVFATIEHYVGGGDIEIRRGDILSASGWFAPTEDDLKAAIGMRWHWDFRIKPREPKAGEVWEVDVGTEDGEECYLKESGK